MNFIETEEFVRRSVAGDTSAFEELYKATSKRVYFVCLNFLGNEHDANDAVQDTYLTAFKNLSQLAEPGKFSAWVERIAINRCINIIRQKNPTPVDDEIFKETLYAEDELSLPEKYIIDLEKRKFLLNLLQTELSQLQYQTVILYYFNNMSAAEIGQIMDCSEGSVYNRLSTARAKIKKAIEKQEKDTNDKLFVFAGVPFLAKLFDEECKALNVPKLNTAILKQGVNAPAATSVKNDPVEINKAKTTNMISKGKTMNMISKGKIIAAIASSVAVITVIGIVAFSGNSKKVKPDKQPASPDTISGETSSSELTSEISTKADESPLEEATFDSRYILSNNVITLYPHGGYYLDGFKSTDLYGKNLQVNTTVEGDNIYLLESYMIYDEKNEITDAITLDSIFEERVNISDGQSRGTEDVKGEYVFSISKNTDIPKSLEYVYGNNPDKPSETRFYYIEMYASPITFESEQKTEFLGFEAVKRTGVVRLLTPPGLYSEEAYQKHGIDLNVNFVMLITKVTDEEHSLYNTPLVLFAFSDGEAEGTKDALEKLIDDVAANAKWSKKD